MRQTNPDRRRFLINGTYVVLIAGCLVLLSWGITHSSTVASVVAGAVLAVMIVFGGSSVLAPEDMRSQATERTLRVASATLRHMRDGLTPQNCQAVCQLLLPETNAAAICMTNDKQSLAFVGEGGFAKGAPNTQPALDVLKSKRMQTFTHLDEDEKNLVVGEMDDHEKLYPAGIVVPLLVADRAVGTIKLYYRHGRDIDRTQLAIARGFAQLISAQLSEYELDRQAELTARAEVKALQAQINPHFLFNALNTMASLTRTDPAKARDLLREFAVFYRKTLENSEQTIPLSEEIAQTQRYLKIEKARFGEDRIIETNNIDARCKSLRVPAFIVQPIVENSVRHAMGDGPLHIDVQATVDGDDVLIAVADDGLGMDDATLQKLIDGSHAKASNDPKGTGIALMNVRERIKRFYGSDSDMEIMSKLGQGTVVTLRLAGAAPEIA